MLSVPCIPPPLTEEPKAHRRGLFDLQTPRKLRNGANLLLRRAMRPEIPHSLLKEVAVFEPQMSVLQE